MTVMAEKKAVEQGRDKFLGGVPSRPQRKLISLDQSAFPRASSQRILNFNRTEGYHPTKQPILEGPSGTAKPDSDLEAVLREHKNSGGMLDKPHSTSNKKPKHRFLRKVFRWLLKLLTLAIFAAIFAAVYIIIKKHAALP